MSRAARRQRTRRGPENLLVWAHETPLARAARSAIFDGLDRIETRRGARDAMVPPRGLSRVGAGDFMGVGRELLDQLVRLGGLQPTDDVLDVGSGSGRVAIPLTRHLNGGTYEGIDIGGDMIAWCQETITPRFPAFRFTALDVANTHYNRGGALSAADVRLPYDDETFDFALATSLFTHMVPSAFANYAAQVSRVLRSGGTLFATFLLVDGDVLARQSRGDCHINLPVRLLDRRNDTDYRVMSHRTPETAVGLDLLYVLQTLQAAGLQVADVHRGAWSGLPGAATYQDTIIARRPIS